MTRMSTAPCGTPQVRKWQQDLWWVALEVFGGMTAPELVHSHGHDAVVACQNMAGCTDDLVCAAFWSSIIAAEHACLVESPCPSRLGSCGVQTHASTLHVLRVCPPILNACL